VADVLAAGAVRLGLPQSTPAWRTPSVLDLLS
jgi:hypothetical protein